MSTSCSSFEDHKTTVWLSDEVAIQQATQWAQSSQVYGKTKQLQGDVWQIWCVTVGSVPNHPARPSCQAWGQPSSPGQMSVTKLYLLLPSTASVALMGSSGRLIDATSGSRKSYYSSLQGTVDERGRFIDIFSGPPGRVHNARMFRDSTRNGRRKCVSTACWGTVPTLARPSHSPWPQNMIMGH